MIINIPDEVVEDILIMVEEFLAYENMRNTYGISEFTAEELKRLEKSYITLYKTVDKGEKE